MNDQIYLSDYVLRIDGSFAPAYSASYKDSFLFLADFIGVNTSHEFSYVHYSMVATPISEVPFHEPLTEKQHAKLDVLVNCDPLVLDILCTIARFHVFECDGAELLKITYELKGHLGNKLKTAEALAESILQINLKATQHPMDFTPPELVAGSSPQSKVLPPMGYPTFIPDFPFKR